MRIATSRPRIRTSIPQHLREYGISSKHFADAVASFGGGRNAAYKLVRGDTHIAPLTMLVAAYVLEEPVDALFWIEYPDDPDQP